MVTNALPSQNEPVIDRYRRWNPVWYRWLKPLLEQVRNTADAADEMALRISTTETQIADNSQELAALETTVATHTQEITVNTLAFETLNSDLSALQSAVGSNGSTIADVQSALGIAQTDIGELNTGLSQTVTSVAALQTTVNTNTISIEETTAAINDLYGHWGVSINANGQIIGSVSLDSQTQYSAFTVVADHFIIAHPTSTETVQAFVIGQIDGVSTVGINGNVIVDNSIDARSITAEKLSAITANLGTVKAGRIESADGASWWDLATGELVIGAVS